MRYTVLLTPDLEEGGYTVEVPALPGCITEGDTYEEAIEMAKDAIETHIAALRDLGEPVPDPDAGPRVVEVEVEIPAA